MFDENLYQETISALHASEDTLSEVMNMTHKTKEEAACARRRCLRRSSRSCAAWQQLQRRLDWISGWRSTLEQRRSRKSCSRLRRPQ